MQIIRRDTDYGIRLLLELARHDGQMTPCRQLAKACGTPMSVTYKVLRKLTNANLLASREGRPGGFRLKKLPKRISLYQIVQALQGPVSVSNCVLDPAYCDRRARCALSAEWAKLGRSVVSFFKQATLADLLSNSGRRGRS